MSIVPVHRLRWFAVSVFIVSTTLNYLDRQLLAALAPLIMDEFHLNLTQYGWLISAFSFAYAASAVFAGWMLDRFGINRAISVAAAWWSVAAAAMAACTTFPALVACRAALGLGESAAVPAVGKLNGIYLKPPERAMGAALNQVGISVGMALAPAWIGVANAHSWRTPFLLSGLIGLAWIPLWLFVSRAIPAPAASPLARVAPVSFRLLLDPPLLVLIAANVLWMGAYSLWSNWTTIYLIHVQHLTLLETRSYVWIPPLISNLGGFFGGWLSLRWMNRGMGAVRARSMAIAVSAVGMLITLALPLVSSPSAATAIISASFFFALAGSVNLYAIPIDLYGPERSGLAISALVLAYGLLQTVISPIIGHLSDLQLYREVIWLVTIPALLAAAILWRLAAHCENPLPYGRGSVTD
jgi:ACS family hexuronate transporter-like MFS transporter